MVPSKRFTPLLQVLIHPETSALLPAKMLDTSHPSSGKSTVGDVVGLVLGDTVGFFVGEVWNIRIKIEKDVRTREYK